jgi:hypothetical protein
VVLPSLNVSVPVAIEGVTVAVNVTDEPNVEGFFEEATVVVVVVCWLSLKWRSDVLR